MATSHDTTTLFGNELEAGVDARKKKRRLAESGLRNAQHDRVMATAAQYFHVFWGWADDRVQFLRASLSSLSAKYNFS